ncbi:MAG: tripartite tricarboxylate transporter TctB family protein [Microbacterium arborescens]
MVAADAVAGDETAAGADAADAAPARPVRVDVRSLAWVVGAFLGFAFLLDILGWIIAAGLLFWCVARAFGSTKHLGGLVVGLTVSSIAYIGFDMVLGMSLPSGILGGF